MEAPRSTVIVALRSLGLAVGLVTLLMGLLVGILGILGVSGGEGPLEPLWRGTSRSILLLSMILYLAWFLYAYFSSFYGSSDGQAARVFLVIGFFAFPVMAPLWGVAAWLHWRTTRRELKPMDMSYQGL